MNPLDLDEAQGLTADMVRAWLRKVGFRLEAQKHLNGAVYWVPPAGGRMYRDTDDGLLWDVSDHLKWSDDLQSILREMNPRMRAGLPSLAAQEAHSRNGGVWIACHGELGNGGSIVFVSFDLHDNSVAIWDGEDWHDAESEMVAEMPNWRFWPCDANANKVRYPVDAKGAML